MRARNLRTTGVFYLMMAGLGILAMGDASQHMLPAHSLPAWGTCLIAGFGAGLGLVLLSRLAAALSLRVRDLSAAFRDIFGDMSPPQALALAMLSGISEELLFRGALQPALGWAATTCIFAMLHVGPSPRFIPWTVMAFVGGAVFAGLYSFSGNVVAPCVAHVTVNFLNLRHLAAPRPQDLGPVWSTRI